MRRFAILLVAALSLAGCGTTSILHGGSSLTATINNPVGRQQLYDIENAYGIALSAALAYKRLPLCRTGEAPSLGNVCAMRSVIVKIQAADRKVHTALLAGRRFVRDNPTISAVSVVNSIKTSVEDFQRVLTNNGVM